MVAVLAIGFLKRTVGAASHEAQIRLWCGYNILQHNALNCAPLPLETAWHD